MNQSIPLLERPSGKQVSVRGRSSRLGGLIAGLAVLVAGVLVPTPALAEIYGPVPALEQGDRGDAHRAGFALSGSGQTGDTHDGGHQPVGPGEQPLSPDKQTPVKTDDTHDGGHQPVGPGEQTPGMYVGEAAECDADWEATYEGLCELVAAAQCPTDYTEALNENGGSHDPPQCSRVIIAQAGTEGLPDGCNYSNWPDFVIFVTLEEDHEDGSRCTLYSLMHCEVGAGPEYDNNCRAVKRQSWTCDTGYIPGNKFNTCYMPVPESEDALPCRDGEGVPELVLIDCASYVGNDYDNVQECRTIHEELQSGGSDGSASYWCSFPVTEMRLDCHQPPEQRPESCTDGPDGQCLKRASQTGGCHAIAHIIECAKLQADYADLRAPNTYADEEQLSKLMTDIREAGCEPCRVLPFDGPASHCPPQTRGEPNPWLPPRTSGQNVPLPLIDGEHTVARERGDDEFDRDMDGQPWGKCSDMHPGDVEWHSQHFSSVPVANSRVVVTIHNPDAATRHVVEISAGTYRSFVLPLGVTKLKEVPRIPYISHAPLTQSERFRLCLLTDYPRYRVTIEELWPGETDKIGEHTHTDIIEQLFGSDSLQWWNELGPTEQQSYTDAREPLISEEIECHGEPPFWCAWEPKRSGYYRLTGTATWVMRRYWVYCPHGKECDIEPGSNYKRLLGCWEGVREGAYYCKTELLGNFTETEPIGIQVYEMRVRNHNPIGSAT